MSAIITENTAVAIAMAHREIAGAEKLLKDLLDAESRNQEPDIRDAFGRRRSNYEFGIPSGSTGHRCYGVSPSLAKYVLEAHIAAKRKELVEVSQVARMELDGVLPPPKAEAL